VHPNVTTTRQKTWNALWVPAWYELDQSLVAGESADFWFYQQPPSDYPGVESYDFVFFNQLNAAANLDPAPADWRTRAD
jgi:hypothetical protein